MSASNGDARSDGEGASGKTIMAPRSCKNPLKIVSHPDDEATRGDESSDAVD